MTHYSSNAYISYGKKKDKIVISPEKNISKKLLMQSLHLWKKEITVFTRRNPSLESYLLPVCQLLYFTILPHERLVEILSSH